MSSQASLMKFNGRLRTVIAVLGLLVGFTLASCDRVDDTRIPRSPVSIVFRGRQVWDVYGVNSAMETRRFIKEDNVPAGFFYVVSDYTGYGGVLLACDYFGNPVAYDLACPVECRRDVRVFVDTESNVAECPVCHSTYSIFENYGQPRSGVALERNWGLRVYTVGVTAGGDHIITN